MADDAQPVEGQDADASGGPYDSYLSTVPEAAKEAAEAWFKDTSKGLDGKLQEAAEFKKTWEPFQQVEALQGYNPEQLSELLAWHQQVTSSDESFKEWLSSASKEAGLTPAEEDALEDAEIQGDLSREEIQKIIEEQAEARIAPLQEQLSNFQQEQAIDAEESKIRSRIDELQKESGVELSEAQKAVVFDLGANDPDDDWVKVGFDRFREIYSEGQKAFVNEKVNAPALPMTGGGTERATATTSFKEAEAQARERFAQSHT